MSILIEFLENKIDLSRLKETALDNNKNNIEDNVIRLRPRCYTK